jgi:two-component system invasion response regulator UvrY
MENKKFKIALVDDHALLREALASLIGNFEQYQVIGSLDNGHELIRALTEGLKPDIILLDLNMPVLDGFDTAKWLQINHPEIKLLILTMYDSEIALIRLLQTGVKGFLKKDTHPNELHFALNSVCNNGFYYSHDTTGKLASMFQKNPDNQRFIDKAILTEAEISFLRLASTDLTYKEIASELSISPRAIDAYRDSLFEKLDVKSRVGLAIYAVKNGIVTF